MGDLEITQRQLNTDSSTVQTQSASSGSTQDKSTIFKGMTKAEAEKYNLLDEFNKANTDGDDTISEEEFSKYTNPLDNTSIKSNSGKRVAQGGFYTVQKGDSLSAIANDFGVDMMQLYKNNKNVIGDNINIIEIGQQLKVSGLKQIKDSETGLNEHKHDTKVFAGMTKAQASLQGGKVLETFNEMSKDGKVISDEDFINYKKLFAKTLTKEERERLSKLDISKPEDFKIIKAMLKKHTDLELVNKDYSNRDVKSALDELFKEIGITSYDELKKAGFTEESIKQNPKEFGKFLYSQLKQKYDSEVENKDGEVYKTQYERLKRGEYTTFEKEQLGLSGTLTEEQLEKYTKEAIKQKYIGTMVSLNVDTKNGENVEYRAALVQGMSENYLMDNPDLKALTTSTGLMRLKGTEYGEQTAKMVAADARLYGLYEGSEEASVLGTKAILESGSEDAIQQLIINNADQADLIQDVADIIVASMPEGASRTAIINAVKSAIATVSAQNGTTSSNTGSRTSSSPASSSAGDTNNIYTPNTPTDNNPVSNVTRLKEQSEKFYTSSPFASQRGVSGSESEQLEALRRQMNIKAAQIKNMSVGDAMSEIITHYDEAPYHIKQKIMNMFKQTPPERLCEAYISGSDELQKFMDQQQLMTDMTLYSYLTRHPAELHKSPDSIQNRYEEISEKLKKPYTGNNENNFRPLIS